MKRDHFTFYRSYYEAFRHLPKKDRTDALMALIQYALDEEVPPLSGAAQSVFTLIQPIVDAGRKKALNRKDKTKSKGEGNQEGIPGDAPDHKKRPGGAGAGKAGNGAPRPPATPGDIEISLPLIDGTEYDVTREEAKKWQEIYPAVDVRQELREMWGWLDANPKNQKTRNGIKRFVTNWLSKEQNRARRGQADFTSATGNTGTFSQAQRRKFETRVIDGQEMDVEVGDERC